MSATQLPVSPGLPSVPPADAKVVPEPAVRLPRLLLGLALAVAFFDLCFWHIDGTPGFSVALFFVALAVIIIGNRETRLAKRSLLILALLAGACVAAAIETCITNTCALLILIMVLAGETFFTDIGSSSGRWISQVVALCFAPGRVFWLGARVMEVSVGKGVGWAGTLIGGCLLILPALVLVLIFGWLLAAGNMIFGSWTNSFFDWLWRELAFFLDPARILLWLIVGFALLPLLRPANVSPKWWQACERIPRLPEIVPSGAALFSSGMILLTLNVLFLIANIADALFLWTRHALPPDVTYKDYVHQGVGALIATVILSAVVLTTIFQQSLEVVKRRELKWLAYLWIAQNLFLILSVSEKLRRYIVEFEMTVARLSTIIFLILVLVGFVLLAVKIARDRSISWLIGGCLLAVFATFYTTQFLDLADWSANYNVARVEKDRAFRFDTATICQWGPAVWPALRRAHELDPADADISTAWDQARHGTDYGYETGVDSAYWREFSLRAWMNRSALEDKK